MAAPTNFAEAKTARTKAKTGVTVASNQVRFGMNLQMDGRLKELKRALDDAMLAFMGANLSFKHFGDLDKKNPDDLVVGGQSYELYTQGVQKTYQDTSDAYDEYYDATCGVWPLPLSSLLSP